MLDSFATGFALAGDEIDIAYAAMFLLVSSYLFTFAASSLIYSK